METLPMTDDLHRSVWFTYRGAIGADAQTARKILALTPQTPALDGFPPHC